MPAADRTPADSAQRLAPHLALLLPCEAAKLLRCSEWWLKEQARNRRVPHTRVGGGYRFTEAHVADIIRRFEVLPDDCPATVPTRVPRPDMSGTGVPLTGLRARTPRRALRATTPGTSSIAA